MFRYSLTAALFFTALVVHATELSPAEAVTAPKPEVRNEATGNSASAGLVGSSTTSLRVAKGASSTANTVRTVPFYSQFADISDPSWQGVGCGIASIAMAIGYYTGEALNVDDLLAEGIRAGAYLDHAGWTHAGLLNLAGKYGLTGRSVSLQSLGEAKALEELKKVLVDGPVLASVYYTFEEFNPIPHLVVITDAADGYVYYNDPAEPAGGGRLTDEAFLRGWKERYITVRPIAEV